MATVRIELSRVSKQSATGSTLPTADAPEIDSQNITSSGTSAQSSIIAADAQVTGLVWQIRSDGGDVYAKFGPDPTAVSGEGRLIKNGEGFREFSAGVNGEKVAVIDA